MDILLFVIPEDSAMTVRLEHLLAIDWPIIQAPMAGVSTPALAAAVSNAGALGSLGLGASSPGKAFEMIQATRLLTARPFNANFFCHARPAHDDAVAQRFIEAMRPAFARFDAEPPEVLREIYTGFNDDPELLEVVLETRPAVASFHFGVPSPGAVTAMKARGIMLAGCATTVQEARQIEAAGLDIVVVQGLEAGGHRGNFDATSDAGSGVRELLRRVLAITHLPVVAAGGLMTGQDIRSMREKGAAGAQLGTAFVACPESAANEAYRASLASEAAHHTGITRGISGRPARGIINQAHGELVGPEVTLPDYPLTYDLNKALNAAAARYGNTDYAAHWAGEGAPRSRAMQAATLVDALVREAGFL
ncbi:NAD(P)H-dependent flavin oxidoreductase [Larsenimonas rhizosphaerae]|uniref:NAD(P)H-dependent flavin oxidoreductase n=1 Tax=Larsenimonas rhizosphaerae TaxID=2944682 RepID=UPI002033D236|nr:nitronate monooxygenase [Larsenimonas rhizosphaerae]MCM2129377.1 nitronate monooxygenase [Larsenimonas rhizosphaerae]